MNGTDPVVDNDFVWNGTTSDLAQQYYRRYKANDTAPPLVLANTTLPDAIQRRLAAVNATFTALPGLLQRALVWDSGFAISPRNELIPIQTLNGVSMAQIAVSKTTYENAKCTVQNCTQTDTTPWYKSLECTGLQILNITRCLVDDFESGADVHLSMWATGGVETAIPELRLVKHVWQDGNRTYTVPAIHTASSANEPAYFMCGTTDEDRFAPGDGSIVIPCTLPQKISDSMKTKMKSPSPGKIVTAWLNQYMASAPKDPSETNPTTPNVLPPPPVSHGTFKWDGTTSDIGQQLYRRFHAKQSIPPLPIATADLPKVVQDRLKAVHLTFTDIPGLLQRALLWDSGYVIGPRNTLVRVRTLDGVSMADIAVPQRDYQGIGCTVQNCTQPEDGRTWYKSLECNGKQMLSVTRCLVDDIEDTQVYLSMWSTGGVDTMIPEIRLVKHVWTDNNITYRVPAIHTAVESEETPYYWCSLDKKDRFVPYVGSIVIPCNLDDTLNATMKERMKAPVHGEFVTKWLREQGHSGFKAIYLVPILLGIGIMLLGVWWWWRRRQAKARQSADMNSPPFVMPITSSPKKLRDHGASMGTIPADRSTTTSAGHKSSLHSAEEYDSGASSAVMKILLEDPSLINKQLPYDKIHIDTVICKGAFGEVLVGYFDRNVVAIKRLLRNKQQSVNDVEMFAQEIQLTASLDHPNIVQFIGVAWNSLENLVMVMEYLPRGDLTHVLQTNGPNLSWDLHKLAMARGLASALAFIHTQSPAVIHRDLKSKNVLLSETYEPKIIDFGVSRRKREDMTMTAGVGTPYWTAPEVLEGTRYTEKSDIYSLGVLLTEIDTCRTPYHDVKDESGEKLKHVQILNLVMDGSLRPSLADNTPDHIRRIILACLQQNPNKRPTALKLVQLLR